MELPELIRRLTFDFYKWDAYTDGEVRVAAHPFLLSEQQFE